MSLAIAINGYDDGLSTGEVRRFLGDALGPSDFRKNASRVARELATCAAELIDLLDLRLPVGCTREDGAARLRRWSGGGASRTGDLRVRAHRAVGGQRAGSRRGDRGRAPGRLRPRTARGRRARSTSPTAASATWCSPAPSSCTGASFNAAAGRLLRARRPAGGPRGQRHDGTNAFLVGDRRGRPAARQRGRDRRREAAEPDQGHLPGRSSSGVRRARAARTSAGAPT